VETVPNTMPDLFWAYTAVWAILAIYIWRLGVRLSALERRSKENDARQ